VGLGPGTARVYYGVENKLLPRERCKESRKPIQDIFMF